MPGLEKVGTEYRWRVADPEDFDVDSFRRKELAPGISAVMGKRKGGDEMGIQSYRFDAEKFDEAQARRWLEEHEVTGAEDEPSKDEEEPEDEMEPESEEEEHDEMSVGASGWVTFSASDNGKWNKIAPISDTQREHGGTKFRFGREEAAVAIRNFRAVQNEEIPLLLVHPHQRAAMGERLDPKDYRLVGHISELRISADGSWLEGRYHYTEEGRDLVRSGKFRHMSPFFVFNAKGPYGEKVGCMVFEVSLVPVPYFREQPPLAAAAHVTHQGAMLPQHGEVSMLAEICAKLGVEQDEQILSAIDGLTTKRQALEPRVVALEAKLGTATQEGQDLRAQVIELKTVAAKRDAETLVAAGEAAGKIVPAAREEWLALAVEAPARARAMLDKQPPVVEFRALGSANVRRAGAAGSVPDEIRDISTKVVAMCEQYVTDKRARTEQEAMALVARDAPELYAAYVGI